MKRQLIAVVAFSAATAWASFGQAGIWTNPVLYENGFEDAAYVAGSSMVGVDGWQEDASEDGGAGSRTNTEAAAGYGKVLDNYRAASPAKVHHVYRSLDNVVNSGTATLSFDAKRYGTAYDNTWLYIDDNSGNQVAYLGMNTTGAGGFTLYDGSYTPFGSLANNQWNQLQFEMHFSGPAAGTFDVTARAPDGSLAGQVLGQPFNDGGAAASRLHIRTYGRTSGAQVDNIRLEQGAIIDKIMHGDFDRLATGTGPDVGVPVGGWSIINSGSFTEPDPGYITIAEKPNPAGGTFADDHALRINIPASNGNIVFAQQHLTEAWSDTSSKLIMTHEHITNADGSTYKNNGNWTFTDGGSHSAAGPYVGLHDRPAGGSGHKIRYWGTGVGETPLGLYTPGESYEFRTSVDMQTKTFDLFVRGGPEYARWTQIGKQLAFLSSGVSQVDRLQFGDYYGRTSDAYIDNVSAVDSRDIASRIIMPTRTFENYSLGSLIGQDGWTIHWDQAGDPLVNRAQVVTDPTSGKVAAVQATTEGNRYTSVYQDLDAVADAEDVTFTIDARWDYAGTGDYAYFALGDSDLCTVAGEFRPSASIFGFRNGHFLVRPGDGSGAFGIELSDVATDPDTWYTFAATMHMTGPDRNTWDLNVYDRDSGSLLWTYGDIGFATDYTDVTRIALFAYGGTGTLYFDNLGMNVPEPCSLTLLALGGLALLGLVRRRRCR